MLFLFQLQATTEEGFLSLQTSCFELYDHTLPDVSIQDLELAEWFALKLQLHGILSAALSDRSNIRFG